MSPFLATGAKLNSHSLQTSLDLFGAWTITISLGGGRRE